MRIAKRHSHLGGAEFLRVQRRDMLDEINQAVQSAKAGASGTVGMTAASNAIRDALAKRGWQSTAPIVRSRAGPRSNSERLTSARVTPDQNALIKNRVALELELGKDSMMRDEMHASHLFRFVSDIIDVGIEILPLDRRDNGTDDDLIDYESELLRLIRSGRGVPAVPLVLLGIVP